MTPSHVPPHTPPRPAPPSPQGSAVNASGQHTGRSAQDRHHRLQGDRRRPQDCTRKTRPLKPFANQKDSQHFQCDARPNLCGCEVRPGNPHPQKYRPRAWSTAHTSQPAESRIDNYNLSFVILKVLPIGCSGRALETCVWRSILIFRGPRNNRKCDLRGP